ncbi:MAG: 4-hydroxy-tetrahydrodipicolinate reductase, partial [Clostridiales bacterium]|nr:4-hydroxy-tetrahydrodipicolinate reductase [Clostridiales bacterium]
MVNIFLNGCCGRMGKAIAALCENNPDYKIVAGGDIIENPNYSFPVYTSLNECTEDFDVIIDFSNAKAVPGVLEFALNRSKPFICCTTALSDETVASILEASEK